MNDAATYASRLRRHYAPLVKQHGATHRAVDWGSPHGQDTRFRVLLEGQQQPATRLLDVGCGVGHLVDLLKNQAFKGSYLGLDLVPEMVQAAHVRHPEWDFREEPMGSAGAAFRPDYVVGSGLFTFADQQRLEQTVEAMFMLTSRVVAFNTLSVWGDRPTTGEFCADPAGVVEFCRNLTRRVVLRHDYLPHDFTIYLYKEEAK